MAGDWIKMRIDLADDPAVIGMAEALGMDEFAVVGRLHALWGWADSQSRDGHARGVTEKWIDRKVQRDGFAAAMAAAGWLLLSDGGIEFPNFDRHNGETAKQRGLATNRKKKSREKVMQDVTDVSRTERDETATREEKRREEKKEQKTAHTVDLLDGVPEQIAQDFKQLRQRLRAPITQTAVDGIRREARIAGLTLAAALTMCCERGWRGFKAEWVTGQPAAAPTKRRKQLGEGSSTNYGDRT